MKTQLTLGGRWDSDQIPAGIGSRRGLLIDVQVVSERQETARPPVNLALVLDRSGSMGQGRLQAARLAALDVIGQLRPDDRLSLVVFANGVEALCAGLPMDPAGRDTACAAIAGLRASGCTDLAGGWFAGARAVSDVLEQSASFSGGHVIVLSDGWANLGETEPETLQRHAAEFSDRKIVTSCIGVGDEYSPLQLDALAEGGRGRLHDAADSAEIGVVILAEVGEVLQVEARDVSVEVSWPTDMQCTLAAHLPARRESGRIVVDVGDLIARSPRWVPLVFECPAGIVLGARRSVEVTVRANDASGEPSLAPVRQTFSLLAVTGDEAQAASVDDEVVRQIAASWSAGVSYQAMRINETGEYAAAHRYVEQDGEALRAYITGTGCEGEVREQLQLVAQRVSTRWDSRSKLEALARAKKRSRSQRDYRSGKSADTWADELNKD